MSPTAAPSRRSGAPLLVGTRSEPQLLRMARDGNVAARDELVNRLLPLTKRLAGKYRHAGVAPEDLEQVACVGLLKAIDRYEPDLGPFVRYAVPNIVGELKRHFRDKGWGMRLPRSLQERFLAVNRATEELSGRLGRSPTAADIASHTGLALDEVTEALEASSAYTPTALDAPIASDEGSVRTVGDGVGELDPHYEFVELGQSLAPTFRALPAREQRILKLRFIDDLTQSEIADEIGCSQMHVSRLLRRALDKLAACAGAMAEGTRAA